MSVERTPRGEWRVRWRDEAGHNRSKTAGPRKSDAIALDQEIKRAKRLGALDMSFGADRTFAELADDWWKRHARQRAVKTQKNYAWVLDGYLVPQFGTTPLRSLRYFDIEEWMADLTEDAVAIGARQKSLKLLRQILDKAVAWDLLASNPAVHVSMPQQVVVPVVPPTIETVERIRKHFLDRNQPTYAAVVSLMAYAGLRPHELRGLLWSDVSADAIVVRTLQKVGAKARSVDLFDPLRRDLQELRATRGSSMMVLVSKRESEWTATTFNNWRRRNFKPAAPGLRPYALRHTFVSLLIAEGSTIAQVAAQAGHSQEVCQRVYSHLWPSYERAGSPAASIEKARRSLSG